MPSETRGRSAACWEVGQPCRLRGRLGRRCHRPVRPSPNPQSAARRRWFWVRGGKSRRLADAAAVKACAAAALRTRRFCPRSRCPEPRATPRRRAAAAEARAEGLAHGGAAQRCRQRLAGSSSSRGCETETPSLYCESGSLSLTPLCCVSGSVVSSTPSQSSSSTSTQARAKACGSSRLLTLSAPALAVAARRAARTPCTTAETAKGGGELGRSPRRASKVCWARKGHARVSSSSPSPQPAAKTSRSAAESQTTECALKGEGAPSRQSAQRCPHS